MIQKPSRGHYNFCILIALEPNKQNPRDRTLDLPFFFCYKHIPSLKNLPSPAPNESSPYWFQGNFAASFVFNFCLREFLLSALVNRFELRCEPKRLMLLYYKICPCLLILKRICNRFQRPRRHLPNGYISNGYKWLAALTEWLHFLLFFVDIIYNTLFFSFLTIVIFRTIS